MIWIILAALALFAVAPFFAPFSVGNVVLVTGRVKSGKSTFSVAKAISLYRKQRLKYWVARLLHPRRSIEKPLFYANIPVKVRDYVPLTRDLWLRQSRFAYGSVIFVDEATLFADSQSYEDKQIDEALTVFNKLIAHETHGGYLIYNTQSVSDLHYSVKRCINDYLFVERTIRLPFLLLCIVRLRKYSADGNTAQEIDEKERDNKRFYILPRSTWSKFDRYAFSSFTDGKIVSRETIPVTDLKVRKVESIKKYNSLQETQKDE